MVEIVTRQGRGVVERTDAMQRGRIVLDVITRQVRSSVCLDSDTAAWSRPRGPPHLLRRPQRRLQLPRSARALRADGAARSSSTSTQGAGTRSCPDEPHLHAVAAPERRPASTVEARRRRALPFFAYYAYTEPTPPSPQPTRPHRRRSSRPSLSARRRIEIAFAARPFGGAGRPQLVSCAQDVVSPAQRQSQRARARSRPAHDPTSHRPFLRAAASPCSSF